MQVLGQPIAESLKCYLFIWAQGQGERSLRDSGDSPERVIQGQEVAMAGGAHCESPVLPVPEL